MQAQTQGECPMGYGRPAPPAQAVSDPLTACPVGSRTECDLFRSVFTLNTLLMRIADKLTADVGLTGSRWLLLSAVVWHEDPPTITELSQRCLLSVQNVSRMIASLESEGLVQRTQVAGEGRATRVVLTDRGREVLAATADLAQRLREGFLDGLADDEVEDMGRRMAGLVDNLRRMEQELSP